MNMSSPFHSHADRLFVLGGLVDDHFSLADGQLVPPDVFLHQHLREAGFDQVMFISHRSVYFLDAESRKGIMGRDAEGDGGRPAGKVATGLVEAPGGLRLPRPDRPATSVATAPTSPEPDRERWSFRGLQESAELAELLRVVLRRSTPRTAVIFYSDTYQLEQNAGRTPEMAQLRQVLLTDFLADTGPANRNCVIFRFPGRSTAELVAGLSERMAMGWLLGLDDRGRPIGKARLLRLGGPHRDEIRDLVDRGRLLAGLDVDWERRGRIETDLAAWARSEAVPLKAIGGWLRHQKRLDQSALAAFTGRPLELSAAEQLETMVGLDPIKEELEKIREAQRNRDRPSAVTAPTTRAAPARLVPRPTAVERNLHVALRGSPGTGKTSVARLLGEIYRELGLLPLGHCVKVTRKDLVAGYLGQSALRTQDAIERALGGVLFIDEAYSLMQGDNDTFGQEVIDTLVEAMSDLEGRFALVIAGYPDDIDRFLGTNEGLPRRLQRVWTLPDYGPQELHAIMERMVAGHPDGLSFSTELEELLPRIFRAVHGSRGRGFGNAGEVKKMVDEMADSALAQGRRDLQPGDLPRRHRWTLSVEPVAEGGVLADLDQLIGLHAVKRDLRARFDLLETERRRRGPEATIAPGHCLFVGNPGTGKTTVAHLMGRQLYHMGLVRQPEVRRTTAMELIRGYQGQSENETREFLRGGLGGVIFIDEAHQLAPAGRGQHNYGTQVLKVLVPFVEDHRDECCVVLAGYPEPMEKLLAVDTGLAGRFPARLRFDDYTDAEMVAIFERFCRSYGDRPLDLAPGFRSRLRTLCSELRRERGEHFANARDARNLFEQSLARQATRLQALEQAGDDELYLLRLEDLGRSNGRHS